MNCSVLKAKMKRGIPHIIGPVTIILTHSKHGQSEDTSSTLTNRPGHSSAARRKHICHRSTLSSHHGKRYASCATHHGGMEGNDLSHHSTSRVSSSQPMDRKQQSGCRHHQHQRQHHHHQCEVQFLSGCRHHQHQCQHHHHQCEFQFLSSSSFVNQPRKKSSCPQHQSASRIRPRNGST